LEDPLGAGGVEEPGARSGDELAEFGAEVVEGHGGGGEAAEGLRLMRANGVELQACRSMAGMPQARTDVEPLLCGLLRD
jgi:hypothetical protein